MFPRVVLLLGLFLATPLTAQDPTPLPELERNARVAFERAEWVKATGLLRELLERDPSQGTAWHRLGFALHMQGLLDEALPAHERAASFPDLAAISSYNVACVHALKGRLDPAFAWLEKALEAGFQDLRQIEGDTDLVNLRKDARYAALLKRLKDRTGRVTRARPYNQRGVRHSTRVSYWGEDGAAAQVAIDHGPVTWKDEYEEARSVGRFLGRRWRMGSDFWTTLDTNVPLSVGALRIPPGQYYLVLAEESFGKAALYLLDPATVREDRIDPFLAHMTRGGLRLPLEHRQVEAINPKLDILLKAEEDGPLRLSIIFGPHKLSAQLTVHLDG